MFCGISLFPQKDTPRSEPLAVLPEVPAPQASDTSRDTTPDTFYQFIIDNNLFRSLGWKPPKQQPDYILIGTAVFQNAADSKAFILDRRSNHLHIVKLGDTLDDVRVKQIQAKQVTLHKKGKDIILRGGRLQFSNHR